MAFHVKILQPSDKHSWR